MMADKFLEPPLINRIYGMQLRSLRKMRELRLIDVATKADIDVSYLSRIESGSRAIPSKKIQSAITAALALDAREIQVLNEIADLEKSTAAAQNNESGSGKFLAVLIDASFAQIILQPLMNANALAQFTFMK